MSIVAAPSTALLLSSVATIVVAAAESLVASILAVLASCLVSASAAETTILATGLGAMKSMAALLLKVCWISRIASLLGLWGRKHGSWSRVCCGSGSVSLGERWAWAIGCLGVTKGLQVIATLLAALIGVVVALVLTLVR